MRCCCRLFISDRRHRGECLQSPSREGVVRSLSFERREAPFVMTRELCSLEPRSSVAHSVRSLRCLRRLRRPHSYPFESRPTQRPHLTPPQPRRSLRSWRPSRAGSRPPLRSGRSQARHRLSFISPRRRRSRLFKYDIGAGDLRYSLPQPIEKHASAIGCFRPVGNKEKFNSALRSRDPDYFSMMLSSTASPKWRATSS